MCIRDRLCILFRRGVLHLLYGGVAGDVMANALVYLTISAPVSYTHLAAQDSHKDKAPEFCYV